MATKDRVYLPNGQLLSVKPVFGGYFFAPTEQNIHSDVFPTGWTVTLQSESYVDIEPPFPDDPQASPPPTRKHKITRFSTPTLQNDGLFISSISMPDTREFKAPASPTRQIAMMLYATLYWYFHRPAPSPFIDTEASRHTPPSGRPKADWRVNIKREGVFRGRNLLPKLERMGLISSEETSVGTSPGVGGAEGFEKMFCSRRAFWQLSARLFLFTLTPTIAASPLSSRPSSPTRNPTDEDAQQHDRGVLHGAGPPGKGGVPGPFASGSHLPTYYPPPPLQYVYTNGVRHPLRPKPPQQGEIFYSRYIPSLGETLTFRCASLSDKPVPYLGPDFGVSEPPTPGLDDTASELRKLGLHRAVAGVGPANTPLSPISEDPTDARNLSDVQLLHRWMNEPRVNNAWGEAGPLAHQAAFLRRNLASPHSFPAIGCWDGRPFGYFEIYWVKEDALGGVLGGGEAGDWDRGVHVLVGEQEFRGKHRISRWLSALVHWCLVSELRTEGVCLEPRVDNDRLINHLLDAGFVRRKEVVFPHKTSAYMRFEREAFDGPAL